ncbi:L-threonylcarbamoyladenylate synthase [Streptococcus uberis]|uniref:L-threonylcarbamoyladenylate synthase n=1 Tax=Streptococcus uberis TaxID=1349 RepID=UPI0006202758|nr:L-threonylcarbamoyladenylate synthase [Streptococcus uberis]KKF43936.1 tRNA threonylcarbamoyl adenosine modification protein [Streptococcus uberis EF20/0145]MCK1157722.1 L-threonylcarbamoyladenylate synthase [Streptococcus uberis]MCK1219976.1 L-threonylcarbamoyladenylate synthase [Streptococcus uberis]MCK1223666.1 L-threonylcarbamoyladenylate synthase [Streptococcus uberis]MCK1226596.1 L-threonylcarbamoyladenylate synthase [Streptococcus uberis]
MEEFEEILHNGGALVLPTETVYGIFTKALDETAVNHVYQLKKRPRDKAMNLNVADYQTILEFSKEQPSYLKDLFEAFLPGPLTIILKANDKVPAWINSGKSTVGFRLPNHPLTADLIKKTGPLIGPSANISGNESGKEYASIMAAFDHEVAGYEDDQAITGQDSTIVDLSGEKAKILRQGALTADELKKVVPQLVFES